MASQKIHNPGDIVFVKYVPDKNIGPGWPAIGSAWEIDCKVLEILEEAKLPHKYLYKLITGTGHFFHAIGAHLVLPKDRELFKDLAVYKCLVDTELCPKDTLFSLQGEYVCNDSYGVYIHLSRLEELLAAEVFKLGN